MTIFLQPLEDNNLDNSDMIADPSKPLHASLPDLFPFDPFHAIAIDDDDVEYDDDDDDYDDEDDEDDEYDDERRRGRRGRSR